MTAVLAVFLGVTPAHAEPSAPRGEPDGVTLITGDRVVITGSGQRIEPGPGRRVSFIRQLIDGHVYVIPSDARPLLAQGLLDRRLFDVTQLLAWRYDDAATADIPLIIQSGRVPPGARTTRSLVGLGMNALSVPKASAARTWKDLTGGVHALGATRTKLWLDGRRTFDLDRSVKQIGAPQAWERGLTGKGVTVAVLDSGYDAGHPDLQDIVIQERNFSNDPDMRDTVGHGTHVASIVAGAGGQYRGVAPGARLAIGKVGSAYVRDSAILAGMEWAAVEVKAKIVNMSLGGPDTPELDPLEQAVNILSERTGALFVVSAGNRRDLPVSSPGSADAALTVGAVDRDDRLARFSSKGPRKGDHAIKPDVTAPGVGIMAAAAEGTADGPHIALSGTSMAAPHVAGAAAILAEQHPDWAGGQLKSALIGSARPMDGATPYEGGAGRVDVPRAINQPIVADKPNVWAAFSWDDSTRTQTTTLTYANSGDAPVTLNLATDGDTVKLSTRRLDVPAGGTASVTLTIDAGGKAPGDYPGTITATSGEMTVRTLAGAYVEPESYDVRLTAHGKEGDVTNVFTQVYDPETGETRQLILDSATGTIRLPKGHWKLYAEIYDSTRKITLAHTDLRVDADRQVTLDGRQGKQVRFSIDDPNVVPRDVVDIQVSNGKWEVTWEAALDVRSDLFAIPAREAGLRYMIRSIWDGEDSSGRPYLYDLLDRRTGGIPEDPGSLARRDDLAKVTATYHASGVATKGAPRFAPRSDDGMPLFLQSLPAEVSLPGSVTYHRTPGTVWESTLQTGTTVMSDSGTLMKRGHTREVWNAAVAGPSLVTVTGTRTGDELHFNAGPLFADGVAGRTGTDRAATGTATLSTGGQVLAQVELSGCDIAELPTCVLDAVLPPALTRYTLGVSMSRQVPHTGLSTAVKAVWEFDSARTADRRPLPLAVMRYAPTGLDAYNRAKPGTVTRVPMWVERNPGAAKTKVRSVRLEASFNDGETWRPVPVAPSGSGWKAAVHNPRTPGFVSLRVAVTDAAGASLTQTITRAYGIA
ncbi:S8 family serine peptidase [Streptosporangium roseum]|uniref:S8 family serine peptidase n=1 Tax=Streptosporangium roseum TaxID=2001 RepID=UPI00068C3F94|nr:S8 family serine peptidase [Streptosporangium roseum]